MSALRPWILVRKGQGNVSFKTLDEAKAVHDMQRRNGAARSEAVIFGPDHREFRCGRTVDARWWEVFGDRRTARPEEAEA